jgi:catechol 2,3-dioxygenase-like lactoylglutathione lyase family enzyme
MLHHVTREIEPAAVESCVKFYGLLGFEPVPAPAGVAGRAVWLEHAGTQIHLMPSSGAQPGNGHFAIVVKEYEQALERLRRDHHHFEPRRQHWGAPRGYVHDPAGNLVELMARPPR